MKEPEPPGYRTILATCLVMPTAYTVLKALALLFTALEAVELIMYSDSAHYVFSYLLKRG